MATTKSPTRLYPVNTVSVRAKLVPYKHDRESPEPIVRIPHLTAFYLNPGSWTESKTANWVPHNVPGRSDPILQWTGSGARTITFEALVTRDISGTPLENTEVGAACDSKGNMILLNKIGNIPQIIFDISDKSLEAARADNKATKNKLELNINNKLNYYRSLVYPNAFDGKSFPPNVVQLVVGSTFGKRTVGARFVVNRVDINITKQTPLLDPIEARVTFTLTELVGNILSSDSNILTDS